MMILENAYMSSVRVSGAQFLRQLYFCMAGVVVAYETAHKPDHNRRVGRSAVTDGRGRKGSSAKN